MAISASTIAMGDGDSLWKAECVLLTGENEGEVLPEVLAAASASSSAGEDSTSKGEERCWLVIGAPLMVTFRGLSGQGAEAQEAASNCPAPEGEEGQLNESEIELPPTVSPARADGTSSGVAVRGMGE